MRTRWLTWVLFAIAPLACRAVVPRPAADRWCDAARWVVEQMPGGTTRFGDDRIEIEDADGCTVWWKDELRAPVRISYDVTVVAAGGAHGRVSDLNCFWMAQERDGRAPWSGGTRHGRFADYDSLDTYYVGYGGNENTTTRFRRYSSGSKPLLPEHDLRMRPFLLQPNHVYHLVVIAAEGRAQFYRDGEKIFDFTDPRPLTRGWFGFRTVHSHLVIQNFTIERPDPEPRVKR
jgi:hypothetical protein